MTERLTDEELWDIWDTCYRGGPMPMTFARRIEAMVVERLLNGPEVVSILAEHRRHGFAGCTISCTAWRHNLERLGKSPVAADEAKAGLLGGDNPLPRRATQMGSERLTRQETSEGATVHATDGLGGVHHYRMGGAKDGMGGGGVGGNAAGSLLGEAEEACPRVGSTPARHPSDPSGAQTKAEIKDLAVERSKECY